MSSITYEVKLPWIRCYDIPEKSLQKIIEEIETFTVMDI